MYIDIINVYLDMYFLCILQISAFCCSFSSLNRDKEAVGTVGRLRRKFDMVHFKDPEESKKERREQLEDFLRRHSFVNVNDPAPSESRQTIRFEALSPLQVAQRAGNSDMVEILVENGAKRPSGGMGLGLRSMSSIGSMSSLLSKSPAPEKQNESPAHSKPLKPCLRKSSWEPNEDEIQSILL